MFSDILAVCHAMTQRARVARCSATTTTSVTAGGCFTCRPRIRAGLRAPATRTCSSKGRSSPRRSRSTTPALPEDAVRSLMQQLHKAMIKELSHGEHDPRIERVLHRARRAGAARPAVGAAAAPAAPVAAPVVVETAVAQAHPSCPPLAVARAAALPATSPTPAAPAPKPVVVVKPARYAGRRSCCPARRTASSSGATSSSTSAAAPRPSTARPAPARRPRPARALRVGPPGRLPLRRRRWCRAKGGTRAAAAPDSAAAAAGVVARHPHAVGDTRPRRAPRSSQSSPPTRRPPAELRGTSDAVGGRAAPPRPRTDAFAAALGNDKGLDEVILEYLSDDSEPKSASRIRRRSIVNGERERIGGCGHGVQHGDMRLVPPRGRSAPPQRHPLRTSST